MDRKTHEINGCKGQMSQLASDIFRRCTGLSEIIVCVDAYFGEIVNDTGHLSECSKDDLCRELIAYTLYLDNMDENIRLILTNLIRHFDFNDPDIQRIIKNHRKYL